MDYGRKMEVAQQLREAAWRVEREAKSMGVPLPAAVRMVLTASNDDFLVAQHRGASSPEVVAKKIETMERQLDKLALEKLAATALLRGIHPEQALVANNSRNSYDVAQ